MPWRAANVLSFGALVCALWSPPTAQGDDQQLVQDYLASRGASGGAVVRPITEDYVGRTFPNYSFFGVIYAGFVQPCSWTPGIVSAITAPFFLCCSP